MKSSGFIKRFVSTALLSLGAVSGAFAQLGDNKQVLVGGTDFDPINPTEENAFIGVDKIKKVILLHHKSVRACDYRYNVVIGFGMPDIKEKICV